MPKRVDSAPQNPRGKVRDPFEDFERVGGKDQRPRIPPPGKSGRESLAKAIKVDAYSRASSIGETLEEQFGLGQWRLRQVVFGMGRRKDLYIAASALRGNDGPNKAVLQDIADKAMDAAESSAGATIGTAIHALREQHDEGIDLSHVSGEVREALDKWVELTAGFEVLASEAKTVCDRQTQIDELWREHRALWDKPEEYRHGPHTRTARKRLDEIAKLEAQLVKAGS
jgi:hypothetical protein